MAIKDDLKIELHSQLITLNDTKLTPTASLLSDVLVGDTKSKLSLFDGLAIKEYMDKVGSLYQLVSTLAVSKKYFSRTLYTK